MHCTAIGKVLLAYALVCEKDAFLQQKLEKHTESTITDASQLKKQLDQILYDGYAMSGNEYMTDMYDIAVPVITGHSNVKYAIGLATNRPISHYMRNQYLRELRHYGREMGSILEN